MLSKETLIAHKCISEETLAPMPFAVGRRAV